MPRVSKRQRPSSLLVARKKRWASNSQDEQVTVETAGSSLMDGIETEPQTPPTTPVREHTRFKKKLMLSETKDKEGETRSTEEHGHDRTIVDLHKVTNFISLFRCFEQGCGAQVECRVNATKQKGFAVCLEAFCPVCDKVVASSYTSDTLESNSESKKGRPFAINKDAVVAAMKSDMGPHKLSYFCETLNLPSVHKKTYEKNASIIYSCNDDAAKAIFERSAGIIKAEHRAVYGDEHVAGPNKPLDIAVSFDGTWMTRGHSSLIGIGCVIDTLTGLVIDSHVMSSHCQTCATTGKWQKANNPHTYQTWLEAHKAQGCDANFAGVSGMMEAEAASVLWGRSVKRHDLRYTVFVGDGDSKAFDQVTRIMPYGSDVEILKEECMNHVSKRLGTALRNLVSDSSKKGITLGGRKPGSLTAKTINKLATYYTRAVRGQDSVEAMKTAVLASLYHCYSTDGNPQHRYCPEGKDSWCFYKAALALGEFPGDHQKRVHTPLDYDRLHEHIWPVYARLTDNKLLGRCRLHVTQNANESLHNSIWARCAKTIFHSSPRVTFSMLAAVVEFNFGPEAAADFDELYGVSSGSSAARLRQARTLKRLNKSRTDLEGKSTERKRKRMEAKQKASKERSDMGYAPGMF